MQSILNYWSTADVGEIKSQKRDKTQTKNAPTTNNKNVLLNVMKSVNARIAGRPASMF